MELVGLGYTSWFVYRYLLFKARGRMFPLRSTRPACLWRTHAPLDVERPSDLSLAICVLCRSRAKS